MTRKGGEVVTRVTVSKKKWTKEVDTKHKILK